VLTRLPGIIASGSLCLASSKISRRSDDGLENGTLRGYRGIARYSSVVKTL
jgi:hypothetical protein